MKMETRTLVTMTALVGTMILTSCGREGDAAQVSVLPENGAIQV